MATSNRRRQSQSWQSFWGDTKPLLVTAKNTAPLVMERVKTVLRPRFPLLAVTVFILALLVLLFQVTDWRRLQPETSLPLFANLVLVGLTGWYVYLTHTLMKNQTTACVIAYTKRDAHLIYIVVENIGKGLARDISFLCSEKLMIVPALLACTTDARLEEMNDGPLLSGIPGLAPGQKRVLLWGPYYVLEHWLENRTVTISCSFSDGGRAIGPIHCPLEVRTLCYSGEEFTESGNDLNAAFSNFVRRQQDSVFS